MKKLAIIYFILFCTTYSIAQIDCAYEKETNFGNRKKLSCSGTYDILNYEEIDRFPVLEIPLALHFWEAENGFNFTCDPNDPILQMTNSSKHLYIQEFARQFVNKMNEIAPEAIIGDSGQFFDMKVRFRLVGSDGCSSSSFYNSVYVYDPVNINNNVTFDPAVNNPDAFNLHFKDYPEGHLFAGTSGLGGHQNNHAGIFNLVKKYLGPPTNWGPWWDASVILHEWGHTMNLDHSFFCNNLCDMPGTPSSSDPFPFISGFLNALGECDGQCTMNQGVQASAGCWGTSDQNLFMAYGHGTKITRCEQSIILSEIISQNKSYYDFCSDNEIYSPLYFNTNSRVVFSSPRAFNSDIIIEEGTTLVINCLLKMGKGTNIIVKNGAVLEIDGGHITNLCNNEEWNGIIVEGIAGSANNSSNGAGRVLLRNDAIIENAKIGVSMDPRHDRWNYDLYGGYVLADVPASGDTPSATFSNCRRAVAFMKHGENGVTDESSFTNVTFENIRDSGVSIWANDGVDFIDCTFTNIANGNNVPGNQHEGIRAESAWVNVQGCTFDDQPFGVVLAVPDMIGQVNQPSNVSSSDFSTDITGIQLMTYDVNINEGSNTFDNNEFSTGELGIEVIGESPVAITNSDFSTDELGVFIQDGGAGNINRVSGNDFMDNIERGCCFDGENSGLEFWANCFQGSAVSDIDVPSGQVSSVQGNDDDEAGNRFTKGGIAEIRNSGVTSIDYHIWRNRNPGDEEYIDNSSGATDEEADNENVDECGAMFAPNPDPDGCAAYLGNIPEILVLLQNLDDHIASAGGRMNEDQTIEQARVLKVDLFKQLISKVQEQSVEPRPEMSLSQLRSLIKTQPEFEIRTFAPSISLRQSNYRRARAELNALNTKSTEEANYVEAQLIYLDFLEAGRTEVSPLQLQFLRSAGTQQGKLNAYARTVLYLVSGERIPIVAPYAESRIDKRSKSAQSDRMITCHPNPVHQSGLFLRISESENKSYYYALTDMRGNSLIYGAIASNQKQVLNTADLAPGVYLLIVRDALNEIIHHDKIVVMK